MAKNDGKLTPMMEQYQGMRQSLPKDVLLFYRLGDFYELFFDDAKEAAGILNVALTKRHGMPMCGVPHHAAEGYIGKLVKAGKRVALAEQISEPQAGKIVKRAISQVITAGTVSDLNLLESKQSNYLAGVLQMKKAFGLAYIDLSTGDFRLTEVPDRQALEDEINRISPSELLFSDEQEDVFGRLPGGSAYDGYSFLFDQANHQLKEHFNVHSLDGFGCAGHTASIGAAGALLHYLQHVLRRKLDHILTLQPYQTEASVLVDTASQLNLDLVTSRAGSKHTLLHALDQTCTPMGGRKLRDWLLHPLRDLQALRSRQDTLEALLTQPFILSQTQEALKGIRDVERTLGRLSQGSGNGRDMKNLSGALQGIPEIRSHLQALVAKEPPALIQDWLGRLREFPELVERLESALVDEPPVSFKEGGIFRDGYNADLDEIRVASREGKQWIADLQTQEIESTGIKSLKVRYNAVFGYFIEVTKSNLAQVPESYHRKQTTANAERFITPELKEMENKILGADERMRAFEQEEFQKLRNEILTELRALQIVADTLAEIDVIAGLAEKARLYNYCRPLLNESKNLYIKDGRHPVLDQHLAEEKFVPNDTTLDHNTNRLLLITGPNMAGKSTYIRQVALLTLMAQMGSFIPASQAEIGLVDRIFTRVGANDDLARGQSTFMVEMNETASIINNATDRSLIVLDEIGRGTSTFDGLSIAWSVAEHVNDNIQARTLFATHYHELTALAQSRPSVQNYNVAVREWNEEIIFLRKIVAGSADRSYGIQVARLAGLPKAIIERAQAILEHLESQDHRADEPAQTPPAKKRARPTKAKTRAEELKPESSSPQMNLFS
ncbi:MAG: DNA mismatch repair protein MutS [Verrucomicrobiales bacterium]|jgi:DNA mismatch repair protein MutS